MCTEYCMCHYTSPHKKLKYSNILEILRRRPTGSHLNKRAGEARLCVVLNAFPWLSLPKQREKAYPS